MSYDLFLWREQPGAKIDPAQLLRELNDTVQFPGIIGIPLTTIGNAFKQQFPDITDGGHEFDWEGDGSYFQVTFTFLDERTASLIVLNCGFELLKSPNAFERIHAVATVLGCRVFNPQEPLPKPSIFKRLFG